MPDAAEAPAWPLDLQGEDLDEFAAALDVAEPPGAEAPRAVELAEAGEGPVVEEDEGEGPQQQTAAGEGEAGGAG
jgi:hypothetical protein